LGESEPSFSQAYSELRPRRVIDRTCRPLSDTRDYLTSGVCGIKQAWRLADVAGRTFTFFCAPAVASNLWDLWRASRAERLACRLRAVVTRST